MAESSITDWLMFGITFIYESCCKDKFGEEEYLPLYESCKGILSGVILETPAIMEVNRTYIKELSSRAMRDVDNGE